MVRAPDGRPTSSTTDTRRHNRQGEALGRANFQLPQVTVQALFFKFDRQKRGRLNFAQFLEMSMYLGNLRTAFERQAFGQEKLRLDLEGFTAVMATIYQPQP